MTDQSSPSNNLLAIHRDLGRLEGRLSAVEREQSSMKADFSDALTKQGARLETLDTKIDALTLMVRDDRAQFRGGWFATTTIASLLKTVLAGVAGAAAALGIKLHFGG